VRYRAYLTQKRERKKMSECVDREEWEWKDCDIEGHEVECYRLVCPSCGDTMNRDCEDRL